MRFRARFGLGMCGLALLAAGVAKADDAAEPAKSGAAPALASAPATVRGDVSQAPSPGFGPASQAAEHHHKGLFGWRHCVECQRAYVKKHDGLDVSPPPFRPPASGAELPGPIMLGPAAANHGHGAGCATCLAGTVAGGPATVVQSYPAGHAVAGGQVLAGNYSPGYAVSGGNYPLGVASAEPSPVGVARSSQTRSRNPQMAATAPRASTTPYDPSVQPSSMIPPQTALDRESTGRPHVLSHMLGLDGISRYYRNSRDEKARDAHAAIPYDSTSQPVTELPASAVYGKDR